MTDGLSDTPMVASAYCPACEPERDPLVGLVTPVACFRHQTFAGSEDDRVVRHDAFGVGFSDAGGESNRQWCALLHRDAR